MRNPQRPVCEEPSTAGPIADGSNQSRRCDMLCVHWTRQICLRGDHDVRPIAPIAAVCLLLTLYLSGPPVYGCYAVIVGREASADGSVLVGHNEQNGGRRILNFRRIPRGRSSSGEVVRLRRGGELPQVDETAAFFWSENPGLEFSDAYLNEFGVAVVSDGCGSREDDYRTLVARGEIRGGGIGYMLRRLVAQRARTAREGVLLAGRLVERFGYVDSGRTYVIADPREAWLLAVVRGRRWVAQRRPRTTANSQASRGSAIT